MSIPEGDYEKGKKLFKSRCFQCHVIDSLQTKTGPTLNGFCFLFNVFEYAWVENWFMEWVWNECQIAVTTVLYAFLYVYFDLSYVCVWLLKLQFVELRTENRKRENILGLIGRQSGQVKGFDYSAANKNKGFVAVFCFSFFLFSNRKSFKIFAFVEREFINFHTKFCKLDF